MDYFNDVLATFLDVNCRNYIAVYGGIESSRVSSKTLNCVQKINKGLTGLERVINDRIIIFG